MACQVPKIDVDGRGYWRDNVFIERLWRSVKYEEVYLHAYEKRLGGEDGHRKILRVLQRAPFPHRA